MRVLDFSNRGVAYKGDVSLEQDESFQMSLRLSKATDNFEVEKANDSMK